MLCKDMVLQYGYVCGFLKVPGQGLLRTLPKYMNCRNETGQVTAVTENGALEHTSEVCAHVSSKWIEVAHCVCVV